MSIGLGLGLYLGRGNAPQLVPFSVVGSDIKNTASGTILQPAVASGNAGDLLIGFISYLSARTLTPPTDWTLSETVTAASAITRLYYRVADGSEGATADWSLDSASTFSVLVARLRGIDPSTPVDVDGSASDATSVTSAVAPSVTTTGPNRVLVCGWSIGGNRTITTDPAMTLITKNALNPSLALAYELIPAAGAAGTRTATYATGAANRNISAALRRKAG